MGDAPSPEVEDDEENGWTPADEDEGPAETIEYIERNKR